MYRYIRPIEDDIDEILTEEYLFFVVFEGKKSESSKDFNTYVVEESVADDAFRDMPSKAQFIDGIRSILKNKYGLRTIDNDSLRRSETMRIGCMKLIDGKLLRVFFDTGFLLRSGEDPRRYPCGDGVDFSLVLEFLDTHEHEKKFGHDLEGMKEFIAFKMNEYMEKMIDKCKIEGK